MRRGRPFWLAGALLLGMAASCGEDEEADKPAPPPGPASLVIQSFISAGNLETARADGGTLSLDCNARLGVVLTLDKWVLRPPDACGSLPQCGYIAISLDPSESGAALVMHAATPTVVLDLASLGAALPGPHRLRAELRLDDDSIFIGDAGTPVADEVDLDLTLLPCPEGAGGMGGAAGSGAGGEGGAAGGGGASAGAGGNAGGAAGEGGAPNVGGLGGFGGFGGA